MAISHIHHHTGGHSHAHIQEKTPYYHAEDPHSSDISNDTILLSYNENVVSLEEKQDFFNNYPNIHQDLAILGLEADTLHLYNKDELLQLAAIGAAMRAFEEGGIDALNNPSPYQNGMTHLDVIKASPEWMEELYECCVADKTSTKDDQDFQEFSNDFSDFLEDIAEASKEDDDITNDLDITNNICCF